MRPVRLERQLKVVLLLLLSFLLVSSIAVQAQDGEETLFTALAPEERDWAKLKIRERLEKEKTVVQVDYFRLRAGPSLEKMLRAGLKGLSVQPILLQLPKIPPVTIVTERVVQQSQGFISWSGRIQGKRDSFVSIGVRESDPPTKKDIALYATIFVGGRTFQISPAERGAYAITEVDTSKFPPEGPPRIWKPNPLHLKHLPPAKDKTITKKPSLVFQNSCEIDVLVAYTSAAKNEAAAEGKDIRDEILTAIGQTNDTYHNSDINQRLHLVNEVGANYEACDTGTQTCYAENGDLVRDLFNLGAARPTASPPVLQGQDAYPLKQVHEWREFYKADIFALWVKSNPYDCGRSDLLYEDPTIPGTFPGANDGPDSFANTSAFSVVPRGCANSRYSMAHEFGHLGAAHHDRPYEASFALGKGTNIIPQDTLYSYGYAHPNSNDPINNWRTIMAENWTSDLLCPTCCSDCPRIPYWSNPFKTNLGVPMGKADQFSDSTPESSADNHTTLNKSAPILIGFRGAEPLPGVCEERKFVDPPPSPPTGLKIE